MSDLFKLGTELLKDIQHPELQEKFLGISGVYARLVFGARMEKGYTQQKLAELAGVGVKTIHRIEGGSGGITDTTLNKVFEALELSHDEIGDAFKKKYTNPSAKELVEA